MLSKIFTKAILIYILVSIVFIPEGVAASFRSGDECYILKPVDEDIYLAGSTISVDAIVLGDLVAAGANITIKDTIFEDVNIAGTDILIDGPVMDDAKIFGENIKIMKNIGGDLIVFGARVEIDRDVTIEGDLIIFAGSVVINGTINGNVRSYSGKCSINGTVHGNVKIKAEELNLNGMIGGSSELSARTIKLGEHAQFSAEVSYWNERGEVDFAPYMMGGNAVYDKDLAMTDGEVNWKYIGTGMFVFWLIYTLGVLLIILLLVLIFNPTFSEAGVLLNQSYARHLGMGALYFAGLPTVGLFLLVTLVGIPIGLLLLSLFGFSLLFASSVTSVVLAYGIKAKYNKDWNNWKIWLAAAIIFPVLKLAMAIPIIGMLLGMIIVAAAYGALIATCMPGKREKLEKASSQV